MAREGRKRVRAAKPFSRADELATWKIIESWNNSDYLFLKLSKHADFVFSHDPAAAFRFNSYYCSQPYQISKTRNFSRKSASRTSSHSDISEKRVT